MVIALGEKLVMSVIVIGVPVLDPDEGENPGRGGVVCGLLYILGVREHNIVAGSLHGVIGVENPVILLGIAQRIIRRDLGGLVVNFENQGGDLGAPEIRVEGLVVGERIRQVAGEGVI